MSIIPDFILKRLYVEGSLRNTPSGWQFEVRNDLAQGSVISILALEVDGAAQPLEGMCRPAPRRQPAAGDDGHTEPRPCRCPWACL